MAALRRSSGSSTRTPLDYVIGVTGQIAPVSPKRSTTPAIGRRLKAPGRSAPDAPGARRPRRRERGSHRRDAVVAAAYDAHDEVFSRLATAVSKYWCCKRAPMFAAEALECFGGNGYVETGPMTRLFWASPLNGIWEGAAT